MGELGSELLFVSGCSEGSGDTLPAILQDCSPKRTEVSYARRLACRTDNSYGKRVAELEEVMKNLDEIEPLLRKSAAHEIVTTQPIDAVVETILNISCPTSHRSRRAKTHVAER